jgi:hypothetical protein
MPHIPARLAEHLPTMTEQPHHPLDPALTTVTVTVTGAVAELRSACIPGDPSKPLEYRYRDDPNPYTRRRHQTANLDQQDRPSPRKSTSL